MKPPIHLRLLTEADLRYADSLRALAGWNQTIEDWRRFLTLQPDGCFLAEWNGTPAGTATTISYGTRLAWIGMVLVHPEYRSRGIGTALLKHCIEALQQRGIRCIKLDATPQGRPLYTLLGFREEWPLSRWEKVGTTLPAQRSEPGIVSDSDWPRITALDARSFGVERRLLLEELRKQSSHALVQPAESATVTGFGLARPGSRATYLGPVMATSAEVGTALISGLIAGSSGHKFFWDIPDENIAATTHAARLGFKIQRGLMRMYLGENKHPGNPQLQFAIADPSMG